MSLHRQLYQTRNAIWNVYRLYEKTICEQYTVLGLFLRSPDK